MQSLADITKFQKIESISNIAALIDIFKDFQLTVKHIVIKNQMFSAQSSEVLISITY